MTTACIIPCASIIALLSGLDTESMAITRLYKNIQLTATRCQVCGTALVLPICSIRARSAYRSMSVPIDVHLIRIALTLVSTFRPRLSTGFCQYHVKLDSMRNLPSFSDHLHAHMPILGVSRLRVMRSLIITARLLIDCMFCSVLYSFRSGIRLHFHVFFSSRMSRCATMIDSSLRSA